MFKDVDVALSSHPSSNRTIIPADIPKDQSWSLAMVGYRYAYHGKAAHAAVVPHEGINALNAVIHLFTGIDALRQHLRDDVRIHGIITDGGKAANVVPDFAAADFMLRSRDRDYLYEVVEKVRRVAEGAAQSRARASRFYRPIQCMRMCDPTRCWYRPPARTPRRSGCPSMPRHRDGMEAAPPPTSATSVKCCQPTICASP